MVLHGVIIITYTSTPKNEASNILNYIPRPIASRHATVLRIYAAVVAIADRPESPPNTIATHIAESTLDDDWVGRTPPAELILPPAPQFADIPTEKKTRRAPAPRGPIASVTTSDQHTDLDPPLPSRNAIPHLVVECLLNWSGHFRTIAGALGHLPMRELTEGG